ncbi:MAG: nicotinate-nucleotide adenylyltransferase [Clostridiales bacterium]|nr:nicotinate-nucleotide adenylyltransferase [Clostridiales bacterium]
MRNNAKKTGIMGGTFNPIHIGHLLLAETAKDTLGLDEVLFIPSGCPYMKEGDEVVDKRMRLAMTALAIEDNPAFKLSAIETEREGNTYTYETLLLLKEKEPGTEFYFIVGADSLFSLETWKEPQVIFDNCVILAAIRGDKGITELYAQIEYLKKKFCARIISLPLNEIAISSTEIRNKMKQKHSVRYMVPDKVIDYMKENHLYY